MEDRRIRGVVFDLDHTLFDRYATLDAISYVLIEEKKDILNPELTREELSARIIEADATCILYGWQKVFERLYEQGTFREGTTAEDYLQYMLNDAFFRYAVPFPFTVSTLDALHAMGQKVGLLTNADSGIGHRRQIAKLRMLGIEDKFDAVLITGDVGGMKPDRRVFDVMTERMGLPAKAMLFVGDHPLADVKGSRDAGYLPVWVRLRETWIDGIEPCALSVKDISEIPSLVERLDRQDTKAPPSGLV